MSDYANNAGGGSPKAELYAFRRRVDFVLGEYDTTGVYPLEGEFNARPVALIFPGNTKDVHQRRERAVDALSVVTSALVRIPDGDSAQVTLLGAKGSFGPRLEIELTGRNNYKGLRIGAVVPEQPTVRRTWGLWDSGLRSGDPDELNSTGPTQGSLLAPLAVVAAVNRVLPVTRPTPLPRWQG